MTVARTLTAARWLPPAAALVYAVVLVRRLRDIADQLTWNADYVSVMNLAGYVARHGKSGRAIVVQIGYYWFDLATNALPLHGRIWGYAPFVMSLLTLALIAWVAARLAGPFAALLTVSLGLAASPLVLATQVAQSYHGTTWFGTALLAAFLCWRLTTHAGRRIQIAVAAVVAVTVGVATASDPLLVPTGDVPFVIAVAAIWFARRDEVERIALFDVLATAAAAGVVGGGMLLADRGLGYASSFPRGLTHLVTSEHLPGNLRQVVGGIFEVAGMPRGGSPFGIVLGLLLLGGVLLPLIWLIRSVRGPMPAPLLAVLAFWSASVVSLAAAFVFSDIPSDFLQNSARYLVSMFYVAVACVPLWAASDPRRLAALAVPAAAFIIANASAVDHAAGTGAFEPSFSPALPTVMAFLEQRGLTRGYAAYDEASPMTVKSNFRLQIYPMTEQFLVPDDRCGAPICPLAYESLSDWYQGAGGPTFILVDPAPNGLGRPPPDTLDTAIAVYHFDRFVIYVYADDVATHMGTPRRFTRPLF